MSWFDDNHIDPPDEYLEEFQNQKKKGEVKWERKTISKKQL